MDPALKQVVSRPSAAWARANLPARYEKLSCKGEPKFANQIGAGAFGRVYKAYDRQTSRYVAVKKLVGIDAVKIARTEYRLGACLNHPQLVSTLAWGQSPDVHREKAYVVLGYIDGAELTSWGHAPRQAIIDVLDSLHYLHTKRIAHNDIHQQNIIVGDKHTWLIDLGRARSLSIFSTRALKEDMRQVCALIDEGLLLRQQVWSVFAGKPDLDLYRDLESLKTFPAFSAWVRRGTVPKRAQLFAHQFFLGAAAV